MDLRKKLRWSIPIVIGLITFLILGATEGFDEFDYYWGTILVFYLVSVIITNIVLWIFPSKRSIEDDNQDTDLKIKNTFKVILKSLKILSIIIVITFLVLSSIYFFFENKKYNQELMFRNTKGEWSWSDKSKHIQERKKTRFSDSTSFTQLRKVDIDEKKAVYAWKTSHNSLNVFFLFEAECKPDSKFKTSAKYSDGTPIEFQCLEDSNTIMFPVYWSDFKDIHSIKYDEYVDGYHAYVNFRNWDFTKLDREITLSKMK